MPWSKSMAGNRQPGEHPVTPTGPSGARPTTQKSDYTSRLIAANQKGSQDQCLPYGTENSKRVARLGKARQGGVRRGKAGHGAARWGQDWQGSLWDESASGEIPDAGNGRGK